MSSFLIHYLFFNLQPFDVSCYTWQPYEKDSRRGLGQRELFLKANVLMGVNWEKKERKENVKKDINIRLSS